MTGRDTTTLEFDAGDLAIDSVRGKGTALQFSKQNKLLNIKLPTPARAGTHEHIAIDYHGSPRHGFEFHPEQGEMYTLFATSQWMICNCTPGDRATLDLSVALPSGLKAIGGVKALPTKTLADGRELHRWHLEKPVPPFTYGFAAGHYVEAITHTHGVTLNYLATHFNQDELRRIFADTADMLQFFGKRAGVPYRGQYSQVLVAKTVGQEKTGFALMSEGYGKHVLGSATHSEGLIAHELAHQWWGIGLTCRSWGHFWLNEGFATFMAAAYLQHRRGNGIYREHVDYWKRRLAKLRAAGKDHALVYEDWTHPTSADRAVVYQKGAYVLARLRKKLGDEAFWRGIRAYTRQYFGQSVTTVDFEAAMEQATGRDLSAFFTRWVYGAGHKSQPTKSQPTKFSQRNSSRKSPK